MICARRFLHCALRCISCCVLRHSFRHVLRNVLCVLLHILRHVLCCVVYHFCYHEIVVPSFCATASLCIPFYRCVGNSVLCLALKCRPIYYHPIFPNIRLIYFNMILTLYVVPCKLPCDFSKITILYIHVHIFIFMTNKSVLIFLCVNKYLSIYIQIKRQQVNNN